MRIVLHNVEKVIIETDCDKNTCEVEKNGLRN